MIRYLWPLVLLTACAVQEPEPPVVDPVPTGLDDTCGAASYADLVGQDATALERVLIMRQVRVIRPGSVITQDLRPERINFEIGRDETIRRISCY